ncbi:MAG: Hsp70 family protein [Archangium sp.]
MSRYVIGIDLGTSNCAVAFTEPGAGASARVVDFAVPQLVRPGEVSARSLLPSAVYAPIANEFPEGSLALPWGGPPKVTGEFARWQASRVPGRVVTSAKSWLIHQGVDRQADILPWGATSDVPRMSPVAAQAALLRHIADAWNHAHPDAPLAQQEVVLTIPASFDEAARALTLQAARDAGFELNKVSLLEEPQAAFYDFTSRNRDGLAKALEHVKLVLVVDVGGGTTDFSLVQVAMLPEGPAMRRVAVGEHLLLGGDNMDAALARVIESKTNTKLNGTQWAQAIALGRSVKEEVLGGDAKTEPVKVTLASAGSKLIGGTLSAELTREEIVEVTARGFFPTVTADSMPTVAKRGAVVELGLPYATDAAITRHVVAFLRAHAGETLSRPDAILLNGGVFNSPVLTAALVDSVSNIWPDQPKIPLLPHDSLDLAVARGAAYSGLARKALGKKIGGGAPRAFYVSVGSNKAVCLIPRGLEEGETVELKDRSFTLTLGKPVQVQLFSTTADRLDKAGDVIELGDATLKPLPPIHTILSGQKGATVQVHLVCTLTEVGTLALSCVAGDQRWRLEFELRGAAKSQAITVTESMPARFSEATLEVERVFGTKPLPVEPKDVKNLFRTLEKILGPREDWTVPVLRELWTPLWAGVGKRRRSPDHEKVMFQLLGYSLRPGVGYPLDDWRVEQTFTIFKDLLTNHGEQPIWIEFWVLWRRIAGGLNEAAQLAIWKLLQPHLARKVPVGLPPPTGKLKGIQPQGLEEMVRCAASLELIHPQDKVELGTWVVSRLKSPQTAGGPWAWALGRLGARLPVYGAAHRVIPAETAAEWAEVLLQLDPKKHDGARFALTQLARKTGDRSRDLDDELRARILLALGDAPESWRQLVAQVVQLSGDDEARALGDTLPAGLTL